MVVGNGLIARSFIEKYTNDDRYLIFASGVSNSKETRESEYFREIELIKKSISEHPDKKFVYFSSSMIITGLETRYFKHKLKIHKLIQEISKNYIIVMLPQVFGNGGNGNNIVNFFIKKIKENETVTIQKGAYRSIVDVTDVYNIVDYCIDKSDRCILLLSHIELISVEKLIYNITTIFNKNITINYCSKDISLNGSNSTLIDEAINRLMIDRNNYTMKVLKKYL